MKLISKEIDIVTVFDKNGKIQPIKFKFEDKDSTKVIKVDKVIDLVDCKFAGDSFIVYKCQSCINNIIKPFELKFERRTCKWYLYKI